MMCGSAAIAGCTRVTPLSGSYALTPPVRYACQNDLFKMEVLNLMLSSLRIDVTSLSVTVMGTPVALTGGPVVGGAFRAAGTVPGTCAAAITLSGTFRDERTFMGTLDLAFAGFECPLTTCEPQRFSVTGTRSP